MRGGFPEILNVEETVEKRTITRTRYIDFAISLCPRDYMLARGDSLSSYGLDEEHMNQRYDADDIREHGPEVGTFIVDML